MKTVFITGATSGIGHDTSLMLGKKGYKLIVCGRRESRLEELKAELKGFCEIRSLVFDVRNKEHVFNAIDSLPDEFKEIDVLINNAGNAHGLSTIQEGDINDWEAMIDINVKGLLYVSKAIIPGMIKRGKGHVVNIGSIAGKEVYPNGNVYCASKHAVDAINNGMRMDLNKHGIKVSQINPGLVETEFSMVRFKGDEERSKAVYDKMEALTGEDIAEIIAFTISRPLRVNLSDIIVLPNDQASSTMVNRKSS